MADVSPIKALYYPHIQFRSVPWLKSALLYWEGIRRIVPAGLAPQDPPEVRELVDAGLIESKPADEYRAAAAVVFRSRLEDLLQTRNGRPPFLDNLRTTGSERDQVHVAKMEYDLLQELEQRGLATMAGQWVAMSPEMAGLYMIALANEAGHQLHSSPITDHKACDVAATYFAHQKVTPDKDAVAPLDGFACARLLLPFPSPEAAGNLTVRQLVDIRTKSEKERRAFREKIQTRAAGIAELPSVEAVRDHLNDLTAEVELEIAAQRDALRSANVNAAWSVLGISAPASISTALALTGAPPLAVSVAGVGAVALGVANWFLQRRKERRAGGHYLLTLEKAVGDPGHDLGNSLGQLAFD